MNNREQRPPEGTLTQPIPVHRARTERSGEQRSDPERRDGQRATVDLRPAVAPPDLDDPAADEKQANRWDWAHLSDTDAVYLADALAVFVAYFNHRYPWTKDQTIPPCWPHHGALVEELTTLMWSRWAAFQGPLAGPEAAQNWHTYHLPLFIARISTWLGLEAAADCRAGHHQPSRLADPDRPYTAGRPPTTGRAWP